MNARLLVVVLAAAHLLGGAAFGQSFDRLQLRPRSQGDGTYLPAVLSFCGAKDWPTEDPECVGLKAPLTVERYNLYWPIAAPGITSCIAVDTAGQMSFVACGEGVIQLSPGDAVFPRTDQPSWFRSHVPVSDIASAAYAKLHFSRTEHAFWTFSVPAGFTNQPTLQVWGEATGSGDDEWWASVRCVEPDSPQNWETRPFAGPNEGTWMAPNASGLNLMVIPLVKNDGMVAGDLCQLDLALVDTSGFIALVYYLEIQ